MNKNMFVGLFVYVAVTTHKRKLTICMVTKRAHVIADLKKVNGINIYYSYHV